MEHWKVVPDILTVAKSMGGGMPLGAFISNPALMKTFSVDPPLSHVTTFGGHPVCCAAGLASLNLMIEKDLPKRAALLGEKLQSALRKLAQEIDTIRAVRGKGLMIGLELSDPKETARFVERCLKAGLILGWTLHTNTVVRIAPPLTLSDHEMREGLRIIEKSLRDKTGR